MTDIRETIINNLRTVCKAKKIKYKDIASAMGVSAGSVSNWFSGSNAIDVDNLYNLCQYLGISLDQAFGVEPMFPEILTDGEKSLLAAYRGANEQAQDDALDLLLKHQKGNAAENAG